MTERTYLFGYGSGPYGSAGRKTKAQILLTSAFDHVDREHMRRLFAIADAVIDAGSDFGFGGGDREFAEQDAEFRRRHYIAPTGIWFYDGHWWQRYDWAAPYAPPGRSWHEARAGVGGALAVDALGDHTMATTLCAKYGLVNHISGEAWHYQPVEIPHARALNQVWGVLDVWALPGTPTNPGTGEQPDMYQALARSERAYDSRPTEQAFIDANYREVNKVVPQTPLAPGAPRKVFIGMEKNAHVMLTVVGATPGFVRVAGVSTQPFASIADLDADGVTKGSFPVGTPEGYIYVWTTATCDFIVDVLARWN